MFLTPENEVKFFSRVKINPETFCWEWDKPGKTEGYGTFYWVDEAGRRRRERIHRIAWQFIKGPIPKHLVVDHLCRVRHCANPTHMELVSRGENVRRGTRDNPNSLANQNRRKQYCPRGHPLFGENLRIGKQKNGRAARVCRECSIQAAIEWRKKNMPGYVQGVIGRQKQDFCRKGHPMSGDNLGVTPSGNRRCKACASAWYKQYKAKRRSTKQATP